MQYNILDILRHLRGGNMGKFYREINDNQYGICEYFEKILKKEYGCFFSWDGINKCDGCEENNETD